MFKVVVAGSRGFSNYELMKERLGQLLSNHQLCEVEIVSGTAKGADQLGEKFAAEFGCQVKKFPAEWEKHGRRAGYIRNAEMAKYGDACVCFWDGNSPGTQHMINLAKEHGIPVKVVQF